MSVFAVKNQNLRQTTNAAGGQAYDHINLETCLANIVLGSMLNGDAYTSSGDKINEVIDVARQSIAKDGGAFAAKTAVYARRVHGLRSVSHLLAAVLASCNAHWKRSFFKRIIRRADDACEIIAVIRSLSGCNTVPNAVKRGIGDALSEMDEYQLAKYKGAGKSVNLYDVVNLCHPRKTEALTALMRGTLGPAETWESKRSSGEDKGAVWGQLLSEGKLGYLACLRNIGKIAEESPDALGMASDLLTNEDAIRRVGIFPHQLWIAYHKMLQDGQRSAQAIVSRAAEVAVSNVPVFEGKTLIAVDASGSMTWGSIDRRDHRAVGKRYIDIAAIFGASIVKGNPDADMMLFAGDAGYINPDVIGMSTMALATAIAQNANGGGTNFASVFHRANKAYDRVIFLSDMQGWMQGGAQGVKSGISQYSQKHKTPSVYSFDLSGNSSTMFSREVVTISGWSDKVFDVMKYGDSGFHALVNEIGKTEF